MPDARQRALGRLDRRNRRAQLPPREPPRRDRLADPVLVGVLATRLRATAIVVVGSLGVGLTIGLVGAVSAVWQVMVLMFAVGWFITPFQAAVVTILQSHSTDATRGRVMSLLNASMSATSVVSLAAAGLLAATLGVSAAFVLGGAVCVSAGLLAMGLYPRRTAAIPGGPIAEPAS